jgi:GT2 family glycosyltransferase
VHALYARWTRTRPFRAEIREESFNFARMVNRGVAMAQGDAILLLNNDVSVMEPDWLDEMIACLAYPGAGIVGAKLLYPNRTIQHAGVILGLGGLAGHWFYKAAETEPGPMGRLAVRNSMTVVTAACMLITRACWEDTGPLDEERFAIAYNDVDFCARASARGHGVIWTPFATLFHHESASRGSDMYGEKLRRFKGEQASLSERHGTARFDDPCYNPWLARHRSRPRFQALGTLPEPRHFHGFPVPAAPFRTDPGPT